MTGKELLELAYDILAQNEVSQADRDRVAAELDHIDYDKWRIVANGNELRLYDEE